MFRRFLICGLIFLFPVLVFTDNDDLIRVKNIKGEVYVRHDISEEWLGLKNGDLLDQEDTIVTGKGAEVVLDLPDRKVFKVDQEVYLDISDIRDIPENIILMMMTREELNNIPRKKGEKLIKENVSVIHGNILPNISEKNVGEETLLRYKINGIKVLIKNGYESSAIVKYREMENTIQSNPDNISVSMQVAKYLTDKKFYGNAKRIYRNIVDKYPDSKYSPVCKDLLAELRGK